MSKYCFIVLFDDWTIFWRDVSGFDFPLFRIEVIGSGADVLHLSEHMPLETHINDTQRHVSRERQTFPSQVSDGLLVGEFY